MGLITAVDEGKESKSSELTADSSPDQALNIARMKMHNVKINPLLKEVQTIVRLDNNSAHPASKKVVAEQRARCLFHCRGIACKVSLSLSQNCVPSARFLVVEIRVYIRVWSSFAFCIAESRCRIVGHSTALLVGGIHVDAQASLR